MRGTPAAGTPQTLTRVTMPFAFAAVGATFLVALSRGSTPPLPDGEVENAATRARAAPPVLRTEAELARRRPGSFRRSSELDPDLADVTPDEMYRFDGAVGGVIALRDAFVLGRHAIAFDGDGAYIPRGCRADSVTDEEILSRIAPFVHRESGEDADAIAAIRSTSSRAKVRELDTAVVIAQFWGESYYHALIEDLPRLAFVFDLLESDYSNATILSYPQSLMTPTSRVRLWNEILGLGPDREWEPYDDDVAYFANTLVVPTATRCGHGQPRALRLVRDRILVNAPSVLRGTIDRFRSRHPDVHSGETTLIVVQKRASRRLLNHDDLVAALTSEFSNASRRCTVIEFLGNETMEETIVLHRQAGIIVGPHGAGLSNALFARPDAALIEIHPEIADGTGLNLCHQRTARALGLRSTMLVLGNAKNYWDSFAADVPSIVDAVRVVLDEITSDGRKR